MILYVIQNESCGCDGSKSNYEVINNSPILSGSQEAAFSTISTNDNYSFLDGLNDSVSNNSSILGNNNNNFSNNDDTKQNQFR